MARALPADGQLVSLEIDPRNAEVASRNITCNAVAPGFINTDMTAALNESQRAKLLEVVPLGRLGEPDDVELW